MISGTLDSVPGFVLCDFVLFHFPLPQFPIGKMEINIPLSVFSTKTISSSGNGLSLTMGFTEPEKMGPSSQLGYLSSTGIQIINPN